MAGYIKLYRDLQENIIWREKRKFSKAEAFIDLMFRCNHKCDNVLLGNDKVLVKRGQFISSNYKLADAWQWSESTVRKYITFLINECMLTIKSSKNNTLYEVVNYCVYQATDTQGLQENQNARTTHGRRTDDARKTPNKNVKNVKNDKNKKDIGDLIKLINSYTQEEKLRECLISFVEMRVDKNKTPTAKAMELIFEKLNPFDIDARIKTIEKSIIGGYSGVFPIADGGAKNGVKPSSQKFTGIGARITNRAIGI